MYLNESFEYNHEFLHSDLHKSERDWHLEFEKSFHWHSCECFPQFP